MTRTLTKLTRDALFALADPEIAPQLTALADQADTHAIVVFRVLDMSSSQLGHTTFLSVGPTRTYKTIADAAAGRLGDVPSRFAHPVSYWAK